MTQFIGFPVSVPVRPAAERKRLSSRRHECRPPRRRRRCRYLGLAQASPFRATKRSALTAAAARALPQRPSGRAECRRESRPGRQRQRTGAHGGWAATQRATTGARPGHTSRSTNSIRPLGENSIGTFGEYSADAHRCMPAHETPEAIEDGLGSYDGDRPAGDQGRGQLPFNLLVGAYYGALRPLFRGELAALHGRSRLSSDSAGR